MLKTQHLISGLGLAGIALCEFLEQAGQDFVVFDPGTGGASTVAVGLYNPVVLKRFSLAWQADAQWEAALPFYRTLEKKLGVQLLHELPVLRVFHSAGEQNRWFEAADKPDLAPWLSTDLVSDIYPDIQAPLGYGKVLRTGRVDVTCLVATYREYLKEKGCYRNERLDYSKLSIKSGGASVSYKDVVAQKLVACEGYGLKQNPHFKYLPLTGTKGEVLTIHCPGLNLDAVIKGAVFVVPLGADLYSVGATYHWKDKSSAPTEAAREELVQKLDGLLKRPYRIVEQQAGIRPTVVDRRPLLGRHPQHKNLYVFNGLGTRGVLAAPHWAPQLFACMENNIPLPPEVDCTRFASA